MGAVIRTVTVVLALGIFGMGVLILMLGLWGFITGRYDAIGACVIGIIVGGTGGALFYAIRRSPKSV